MVFTVDILNKINQLAPFSLTMDFDNTGLLVGDPHTPVTKALLCLDCTMESINQAKAVGAQLIVTHHPVIFHPLKKVTAGSVVYRLIRENIGVISAHTNLDIAAGGVNDCLAQRLSLQNVCGLSPVSAAPFCKVVTFVPTAYGEQVYKAMADAGAGAVGAYAGCAYFAQGVGAFLPLAGSSPFIGEQGKTEQVEEVKIEMVCPGKKVDQVVAAIQAAHPYETPAYDVFEDSALTQREFLGRVGDLPQPLSPEELALLLKKALGGMVKFVAGSSPIQRVAVCGGSGASELKAAAAQGAQALVTGDVKHDVFVQAQLLGLTLLDAGHFHTEDIVLEPLCQSLGEAFPQVEFTVFHPAAIQSI